MTKFFVGVPNLNQNSETVKEASQTIDSAVQINDPVFFDVSSLSWKRATFTTPIPQGVFGGNGVVVTFGSLITTGLTAGKFYFLDPVNGGITEFKNNIFIGYAKNTTELLVDIDSAKKPVSLLNFGYLVGGGGVPGFPLNDPIIQKLNFTTLVTALITNQLQAGHQLGGGVSAPTAGYAAGGNSGNAGNQFNADVLTIHKVILATETTSITGNLIGFRAIPSDNVDSETDGYLIAGNCGGFCQTNSIEKILFTTDLSAVILATYALSTQNVGGLDDGNNGYGYGSFNLSTNITKLNFATEITQPTTSFINGAKVEGGNSSSTAAGYSMGNQQGGVDIQKLVFSTQATSVLGTVLPLPSGGQAIENTHDSLSTGHLSSNTVPRLFGFATETLTPFTQTLTGNGSSPFVG